MAKRNSNQTPAIYGIAKIVTVETELISGKLWGYCKDEYDFDSLRQHATFIIES